MNFAWWFNLDADEELRRPHGYRPATKMQQRIAAYRAQWRFFLRPGDIILPKTRSAQTPHQLMGQAWCPTPHALHVFERNHVRSPPRPSLEILQRVNHRQFCATLGQTLPDAGFVEDIDVFWRHVSGHTRRRWRLKRAHGFSGRGQRDLHLPDPSESTLRWIASSFRDPAEGSLRSGLQVEPWVECIEEFAMHGYLSAQGQLHLGLPTKQICDRHGAWQQSRRAQTLLAREAESLLQSVHEVAEALRQAGYFGPFGVDAYRWRDAAGKSRFNARSEINARYSMGWPIGMGAWRPSLE